MSDISKISISILYGYMNDFSNEKSNFSSVSRATYNSSYINNSSDDIVLKMKSSLDKYYGRLDNGYSKINEWFSDYVNSAIALGNYIAGSGSYGSITEDRLRNYASYNLKELPHYKAEFRNFQLKGSTSMFNKVLAKGTGAVNDTISYLGLEDEVNFVYDVANAAYDNIVVPYIKPVVSAVMDFYERANATVATGFLSLAEGVYEFAEDIVDFLYIATTALSSIATGIVDGVHAISSLITGNEWESMTKKMWNETLDFTKEEHVKNCFNEFYESNVIGQYLKEKSFGFDTVRSVGSSVGYTVGIIGLSFLCPGSDVLIAGAAGTARGINDARRDGATISESLLYGAASGAWESFQWCLGRKFINNLKVGLPKDGFATIGKKVLNSSVKVMADSADSAVEGFVQPALKSIYKDSIVDANGNTISLENKSVLEKYKELFNENGGWQTVLTQAAIGGFMSGVSEIIDIRKYNRQLKETGANTIKNINELSIDKLENNSHFIIDGVRYEKESVIDAFKEVNKFKDVSVVKLNNKLDSAIYFNDPMEFIYAKVANGELLDANVNAQANNIFNSQQVFRIDSDNLEKLVLPCLSDKDKLIYSALKEKSFTPTSRQKNAIASYTFATGPAVTSFQRGNVSIYKSGDGQIGIYSFKELSPSEFEYYSRKYPGVNIFSGQQLEMIVEDSAKQFTGEQGLGIREIANQINEAIEQAAPLENDLIVTRAIDNLFFDGKAIDNGKLEVGTIFNDKGFVSTSVSPTSSYNGRQIELKIRLPKGTKGMFIDSCTGVNNYNMQEFLLAENSTFKIVDDVKLLNGKLIVEAELVLQDKKIANDFLEITQEIPILAKHIKEEASDSSSIYAKLFNRDTGIGLKKYQEEMENFGLIDRINQEKIDIKQKGLYSVERLAEHGEQHVGNVLEYAAYLAKRKKFLEKDVDIVIDAAKYHDCTKSYTGGINEKNHAMIAASEAIKDLTGKYSQPELNKIATIIEYHNLDSIEQFNMLCQKYNIPETDKSELFTMATIIKDADALDRVRFPGGKAHLDTSYLRNSEALELVNVSYSNFENQSYSQLMDVINSNKINNEIKSELIQLRNQEVIPDSILLFAYKYFNNVGRNILGLNSITEYAEYIFQNKKWS